MKTVDLHVHSNKSDGSFSPAGLVDYALEKGLSAFALTDHDTTAGIKEAQEAARQEEKAEREARLEEKAAEKAAEREAKLRDM